MSNENSEQDIIELTHKILNKLGLEIPDDEIDDYMFLRSDAFYIQIFKTIVGNSPSLFDEDRFMLETENMTEGERIQALINKLDSEILQIDLSHIKGKNIADGETKDIVNILQLLDLLSVSEEQEEEGKEPEGGISPDNMGTIGEMDYEKALNNSDSLEEEKNLNIESSNRVNNEIIQIVPSTTKNFNEFGDAAEAIKTEEDLMDIMEKDGEIKFTHDSRNPNEDQIIYEENQVLEPKMKKRRKKGKRKSKSRAHIKPGMRKKKTASRVNGKKRTMKKQIVSKIEENIYGKKRRKKLKKKKLTKSSVNKSIVTNQDAEVGPRRANGGSQHDQE